MGPVPTSWGREQPENTGLSWLSNSAWRGRALRVLLKTWREPVVDPLDVSRIVFGSGVAGTAVYQVTKALRTAWVERSRRKTMLAVMDRLIEREQKLGQPGPQLEVVRPPPDQLDPPASQAH
jgi:hypothetical protein